MSTLRRPMRLQLDTDDPTPPYEQVRRQLEHAIQYGAVPAGQRLPPIRQLARDLGLAVGTVARAYRELESAGLVTGTRGGGTRVQAGVAKASYADRVKALDGLANGFVSQARLLGLADDSVHDAVSRALG